MPITELLLADDLMPSLKSGDKTCTIRAGKRDVAQGPLTFTGTDSKEQILVNVTSVIHKKLKSLTDLEAQKDGAGTAEEMAAALKRFYPDIGPDSDITIIEYDPPQIGRQQRHADRVTEERQDKGPPQVGG